jgi:alanine dehydrogenase
VPNIPSRVARTASIAISNVFAPIMMDMGALGDLGRHLKVNVGLRHGVYMYKGILTNEAIGSRLGLPSKDLDLLMAAF